MTRFDYDWTEYALCRSYDPSIWFPAKGRINTTKQAKKICRQCPVMLECRIFSLKERLEKGSNHIYGIWGGLTRGERHNIPNAKDKLDEAMRLLERANHG